MPLQPVAANIVPRSEYPAIPLIDITTETGESPTFTVVEAPENCNGDTISDNEFVSGRCSITNLDSETDFSSKMKIRVRGNMSAVVAGADGKLPYKLVLNKPVDLLGNGRKDTRYVLLADAGTNLKTEIGFLIGRLCGVEWTPDCRYVNVILNGDWRGLYLLTESLDGRSLREHIGEGCYLFESDAYFWNQGGIYFQSGRLAESMGYTVKYPDISDMGDTRLKALKDYINKLEENIFLNGDYLDYIDEDSFIEWILTRDILGHSDPCGSNIYYYFDMRKADDSAYQLKMAPLWDFDAAFVHGSGWSEQSAFPSTYFYELLNDPSFYALYRNKWEEIKENLYTDIETEVLTLIDGLEGAIDESRRLDAARWGDGDYTTMRDEAEWRLQWLNGRIVWMDEELSVEADRRGCRAEVSGDWETMTITLRDGGYDRVRFPVWSDENGQDDIQWYEAQKSENGDWVCMVDLTRHHSAGLYILQAYVEENGKGHFLTGTAVRVEYATGPEVTLSAEVSEDCATMWITLRGVGEDFEQVYFPTWSDENGQDDIQWYAAERGENGEWTYTVDLADHHSAGTYIIHAYAVRDGELEFWRAMSVEVAYAVA